MQDHCLILTSRWWHIPVNLYRGTQELNCNTGFAWDISLAAAPAQRAVCWCAQELARAAPAGIAFRNRAGIGFRSSSCPEGCRALGAAGWLRLRAAVESSCTLQLLEFTSRLAGAVLVKRLTHAIKALSHQPKMLLLASSRLQQAFPILELALISELGSLFSFFSPLSWKRCTSIPFISLFSLERNLQPFPVLLLFLHVQQSQLSKDFNAF